MKTNPITRRRQLELCTSNGASCYLVWSHWHSVLDSNLCGNASALLDSNISQHLNKAKFELLAKSHNSETCPGLQ
jgi:hypothetical protein